MPALVAGKRQAASIGQTPPRITTDGQRFLYYFYDAQRALDQEDYTRGIASLIFLHRLNPADAATNQRLGTLYQALQQDDNALKHYRSAWQGDPLSYWSNYAALLFQTGDNKDAAKILEQAAKLQPDNTDITESLITVYSAMGKTNKAIKLQEKAIRLEGMNPYNIMNLYKLHTIDGQQKKAIQTLERYLTENPEDYRLQVFRGDVYLSTGNQQQALRIYKEEEQRHPDNPFLYLSLANYYTGKGDTEEATRYIMQAVRSTEWDVQQKLQMIQQNTEQLEQQSGLMENILQELAATYPLEEQVYQAQSHYYIYHGNFKAAKPALHAMTDINPDNTQTWTIWLQVLQNDTTATNAEYEHVIRNGFAHQRNDRLWYYWMAHLLLMQQQPDSAFLVAKEGLSDIASAQTDIRYTLGLWGTVGDIHCSREEYEAAFAAYEEALKIDPQNLYVLNNYAYTLAVTGGDLKKAERMSQKTIEKEPDNATYLDTYAWILHLQGQDILAEFYIKRAIDHMGNNIEDTIAEHYHAITKGRSQ